MLKMYTKSKNAQSSSTDINNNFEWNQKVKDKAYLYTELHVRTAWASQSTAEAHHKGSHLCISKKRNVLLGRRDHITFIASLDDSYFHTKALEPLLGAPIAFLLRSPSAESLKGVSDTDRKEMSEISMTNATNVQGLADFHTTEITPKTFRVRMHPLV